MSFPKRLLLLAGLPVAAQQAPECDAGFHLFDHELLDVVEATLTEGE